MRVENLPFRTAIRLSACLIVLLCASGCCSVDERPVPTGQSLATPGRTLDYLIWGVENRAPSDVYNCFSEGLRERENLSRSDLATFWPQVEDWISQNIGDVRVVKIIDQKRPSKTVRILTLASGDKRASVRFVREATYEVTPRSRRLASSWGEINLANAVRYEGEDAIIRLPKVAPQPEPEGIYRIVIENAWRVDGIEGMQNLPTPDPAGLSGDKS